MIKAGEAMEQRGDESQQESIISRAMTQSEKIKCSSSLSPPAPSSCPHDNPVIPHNVLHCSVFLLVKEAFPIRTQPQDPLF